MATREHGNAFHSTMQTRKPAVPSPHLPENLHHPAFAHPTTLEQKTLRSPRKVLQLQRLIGNRALGQLLNRKPLSSTISASDTNLVQRDDYTDETYAALPYASSHKPPAFEYWVNTMWAEVLNVAAKEKALALLKGTETGPRAGSTLDVPTKKAVLDELYKNAYQERLWVTADELIREGSLIHQIQAPKEGSFSTRTTTIAAGFHGTWRDPDTLLEVHKGTTPTIERHGKAPDDKKGIQEYMKTQLGIEEWHPFWFGGDISTRPFLYRNKQEDNELDTTISVAKSHVDAMDFPMIESMNRDKINEYDENGLPVTYNYVYLVGVTQGFGTTVNMQKKNAFGEGEMATQSLNPDDHLGYVKYRRVHAGGSRNDGYSYERVFQGILPGARKKRISGQVQDILNSMPARGVNRTKAETFDFKAMYEDLVKHGKELAESAKKARFGGRKNWTDEQWKKSFENIKAVETAPTPEAKTIRLNLLLKGVRSVLPAATK